MQLAQVTLSTLLYCVQLLVDQHPHEHQQKYPRPDAEHAHRDGKPVDLCQKVRLLLVHVRTRVIQKQLVIPVHGECALVDQEDDRPIAKTPKMTATIVRVITPTSARFQLSSGVIPARIEITFTSTVCRRCELITGQF